MCLIIVGKSNQVRNTLLNTPELAEDIYLSNSDGIGAMYTTAKGRLRLPKIVPQDLKQFVGFIKQLPQDDRNIAIHARYKTHGDIDLENCHPYVVLPGRVAMMHNGVLDHGNKADPSKSDTWHYIQNYVRPMLEENPKLFMNKGWQSLVSRDITGSNRFVLMDDKGDMVILNRHTGIEHEGLWFSNTYAWSPELLIPGYKKPAPKGRMPLGWGGYGAWDYDDYNYGFDSYEPTGSDLDEDDDDLDWESMVMEAVGTFDPDELTDLLLDKPNTTLRCLFKECEFICSVDPETGLSEQDRYYVKLLETEDVPELAAKILFSDANARKIAEIACWYGEWFGKSIDKKEPQEPVLAAA